MAQTGAQYVPDALAVQYGEAGQADGIDARARSFGGMRVADLTFGALHVRSHVVSVDPARIDAAMRELRGLPGVRSVTRIAYRRRMTATDPYYAGVGTGPYYQSPATHGQWDMHAINVAGAWSQLGSAVAAPIAIVDTGADLWHPELGGSHVIRTECFVTYPTNAAQTTGTYVTDTDGHGTNVAGIADAFTNNGFAFAGTADNEKLMVYRIFPTDPAGGCDTQNPPDQCNSDTVDEASAINDAVGHGAKVINLSLGGSPPCSQTDPEYAAVENAIRSGVVVVAAAGNGDASGKGYSYLDCPAADPGVIAAGASALDDTAYPTVSEYTASYSNYLTSKGNLVNGAYLIAPGGDPSGGADQDNLHWIQNIYSTAAYDASQRSSCSGGLDSAGESNDCNVEIAGTSMATPHVAGVAAMMLGVNPALTPAKVAQGLCASADPIGDPKEGCGRLNAGSAVTWAKNN